MRKQPLISIIIPIYNAANVIFLSLESIIKQKYKNIEIIIVNDCSTDRTIIVLQKLQKKIKQVIQIVNNETHQERTVSRNVGARRARGEFFLFIDADMELSEQVIIDCVKAIIEDKKIKAIIVPELSKGEGFWSSCRALEKRCYIGDANIEAPRFIQANAFWSVGGWNEKMVAGEDWDLTRRLKNKFAIGRINSYIYHYEGKMTLFGSAKKKFYYARMADVYLSENKSSTLDVMMFVIRPAFLRNWKLLLSDPYHAGGIIILKTTEFIAGCAGLLFSKL